MARVATVLCAKSVEKDAFQYFMFLRSLISNFCGSTVDQDQQTSIFFASDDVFKRKHVNLIMASYPFQLS